MEPDLTQMISTNTFENAKESYMWTRRNKLNSIIVVSSFYHLPRAKLEFGRFYKDKSLIFVSANDNLIDGQVVVGTPGQPGAYTTFIPS